MPSNLAARRIAAEYRTARAAGLAQLDPLRVRRRGVAAHRRGRPSPILMRGGWVGFWLGLATAAETILPGILWLPTAKDTNREPRSLRNGPRVQVQRRGFSASDEKARS